MAGFNVQEFRSTIDRKGLMRSNRFLVTIPAPRILQGQLGKDERDLQFYCKAVPLPGIGILTDDVHRYGYGPINRTPYGVVYNDAMFQFYVDTERMVRRWFRMWIVSIVYAGIPFGLNTPNDVTGSVPYEFGYKEDYAVDIRVTSFDSEGNEKISVVIAEAFPNYIGETYQDWDNKNSNMILPVSITFRDWNEEQVTSLPTPGVAAPTPTPTLTVPKTMEQIANSIGERG
jgi:hypothetical protein